MAERIYIVNARRIPCCKTKGDKIPPEEGGDGFKKYPGKYESVGSVEMLAWVFEDLLKNTEIPKEEISDIVTGCALQDTDQGANVTRQVQLTIDLPQEIPAVTVNRLCGSSLTATMKAAEFLIAGNEYFKDEKPGVVLVGGVEHMGNHDMMVAFEPTKYFYDNYIAKKEGNIVGTNMGLTSEKLAKIHNISRKEQETFAYHSHRKAVEAVSEGKFKDEIIPVTLPTGEVLTNDVGPRAYESLEDALKQFSKLKPAFKNGGTVTAATSAPFTAGAAGLYVVTESYMKKKGLEPMAEIISWASVGVDPTVMGYGPVEATKKALKRADLGLNEIGLIELNEAFCAQALASIKGLCKHYNIDEEELKKVVNVNGGATALGHPLGGTGAKLLTTMVHEFKRRPDVQYGLVTMCIGMGQGDAMIIRNCNYKN